MRFFILLLAGLLLYVPLCAGDEAFSAPPPVERKPWDLPVQLDPNIKIGKIYDFLNDTQRTSAGHDPVLRQEFKYFNHGAITNGQRAERIGHYYIVNVTNDGPAADLIIRMDFRQLLSRDAVNTLEAEFKNSRGDYKQQFVIAGEQYRTHGDVNSWRVAVVKDGKIVAQKNSYVW
ncbi:MAG: hypothetical protein LBK60_05750 [Verrucomicrobiales bacterium]|jgi:hypothetical protein|nr:hypothetical protein [Verrucomicrobiales bacterium]